MDVVRLLIRRRQKRTRIGRREIKGKIVDPCVLFRWVYHCVEVFPLLAWTFLSPFYYWWKLWNLFRTISRYFVSKHFYCLFGIEDFLCVFVYGSGHPILKSLSKLQHLRPIFHFRGIGRKWIYTFIQEFSSFCFYMWIHFL